MIINNHTVNVSFWEALPGWQVGVKRWENSWDLFPVLWIAQGIEVKNTDGIEASEGAVPNLETPKFPPFASVIHKMAVWNPAKLAKITQYSRPFKMGEKIAKRNRALGSEWPGISCWPWCLSHHRGLAFARYRPLVQLGKNLSARGADASAAALGAAAAGLGECPGRDTTWISTDDATRGLGDTLEKKGWKEAQILRSNIGNKKSVAK